MTTRTTTLTSVPHTSFALRFSDLEEIESSCKEDEEQRAVRTLDWIGERVHKRSARWIEDMEKANEKDVLRTPWWDDMRRCAEGDHIPSRMESWNHPAASACLLPCLTSRQSSRLVHSYISCVYDGTQSSPSNHSSAFKGCRFTTMGRLSLSQVHINITSSKFPIIRRGVRVSDFLNSN